MHMPRGRKKVIEQAMAIFDGAEEVSAEVVEEASTVVEKEPVGAKPA